MTHDAEADEGNGRKRRRLWARRHGVLEGRIRKQKHEIRNNSESGK
jgi:hypothetical protein